MTWENFQALAIVEFTKNSIAFKTVENNKPTTLAELKAKEAALCNYLYPPQNQTGKPKLYIFSTFKPYYDCCYGGKYF